MPLGWAMLFLFVTLGELGGLLKLPDAMVELSPFQHVSNVLVQPVDWVAELTLLGLAAVVLGLAWLAYRARDISG